MALVRLLPVSGTYATGTLTLAANAVANETVTIGSRVYTWKAAVGAANEVLVGANASDSCDNLIAAINAGAGEGSLYGTGTVAHTQVTAVAGAGDTVVITSIAEGPAGTIATTETMTNGSWGGVTTLGGGATTVAAPTLTDGTLGKAINELGIADQVLALVQSNAGSGVMTATVTLWGWHVERASWFKIGVLNAGAAIAETTSDAINYAELVAGLRRFSRLYAQLASAGTAQEFGIYVDPVRATTGTR